MKIDTHLHCINPDQFTYPWTETFPAMKKRFSLEDYQQAIQGMELAGAVFMEVDVAPEETRREAEVFCRLAEDPANGLLGVVASGRPQDEDFEHHLDAIAHPALKGIRRVLHMAPDGLSRDSRFRTHVGRLGARNLSFDLCVRVDQFAEAADLVDACPKTQFILDHCGNPGIAGGESEPWAAGLKELARRENLAVKLSGLPAACPEGQATADTLRPWVETTIESFGWERVVWGGDWPVCTLNGTLASWVETLDSILAGEPMEHLEALYVINAKRIYQL